MNAWGRRDPRSKAFLALALSFAAAVAPPDRTAWLIPVVGLLLATCGLDRSAWRGLARAVILLWGLSLLANAFFVPGVRLGPEALGWLRPTLEGVRLGLIQGVRILVLAGLGVWVARTVAAIDLAASLEWGARSVPWLRRRVHRAVLPAVLAARLVPGFVDEARRIQEVEHLRKGAGGDRSALRRAAGFVPLWLALVVERAESLAVALVLRGYRTDGPRGFARSYRLDPLDWGLMAASAAVAFALGGG